MEPSDELQEHAEHARAPFDKRVAATMAMIAAALAVVSVLGHIKTTEELLLQQKASDQWAFYQAKSIRRYESEIARDIFSAMTSANAAKQMQEYTVNFDKYRKESDEISKEATNLEHDSHVNGERALRLHLGEIFLEIAIVFASLAILTKRPILYWTAVTSGLIGITIALTELLVHA
jgi:DNA polymerase III delta prime subunit